MALRTQIAGTAGITRYGIHLYGLGSSPSDCPGATGGVY